MKLIAILVAAAVLLPVAARAECFSSARAVWSAHQGAWATWRNVEGRKCWTVGQRHAHENSSAGKDAGNDKGNARLQPHGRQPNGTHSSESSDKTVPKTVRAGALPAARCDRICRQQLYQEFKGWYYFEGLYGAAK